MLQPVWNALVALAGRIAAAQRRPQFTCADCERAPQCGLPPRDDCLIRIERISRKEQDLLQRVAALVPW